ncbi:pentatricopeptide repeat-containing protein At3g02650, mitochondrial isoform X3 [Solanum tuberosum]|uniref:Pentatricopeptide repeat-containing protein n=2 Tax=Solanum tuberosum TaxID=4113 RepID=M1A615_SOLTU|nr:PREDICTED: pentatricopeptide repeat-containing protein At3g02650, mitochondrial isoform X1 [Solanum tuberosum]XP_015165833.1 PREDICTED: pentatricopeptide repeat-containing protein At3g02650, mitochondrial isoform X2 [Solanum tuberosum]XP_015165834.1 PREDICTED: pentatricopeptide repeat-containing protein At3g02650, mitochondrial isoform X3 [Solanum tuberosum]
MWRQAVLSRVVARKNFHGLQNRAFVTFLPQVSRDQTLAPVSSFASSFRYYSHWVSSTSCLRETTRLFSSNPSEQSESLGSEPFENDKDSVFGGVVEGSSVFDGIEDTLAVENGSDLGDNEVVVEDEEEAEDLDLEKLESVLSLLQSSGNIDGSVESSLEEIGLSLNEELVVRVLETPYVPGENLISFFKWVLKKPEFVVTSRAVELLVTAICIRGRNVYALWDMVKEIGEKNKGILSGEILNELIALLSRLGKGKAAFEIFNKFGDLGCAPNADTYYFTIEALSRRSIYDWASTVCEKMLNADMLPGAEKVGKIVSFLCKGNKSRDAHLVYLSAKEKNINLPVSSIKLLISSLCRKDEGVNLAMEMLDEFPKEERKHAIKSFSHVINGLCRANDVTGEKQLRSYCSEDIEEAKNLLLKMIDAGPPPGNAVFNTVINALSKKGEMGEARKLLKVMEGRGLKPDVYTYSVIMSGYTKGGEMEEACKILNEAKKKHSNLSPVTYHTIIRGYCKLEQYDKALELLGEMKEYGVQPNADEYNKFIQSLCLKALDWTTAEKLLEEMKENGVHLNAITKGLVRAVKELEQEEVGTNEITATA